MKLRTVLQIPFEKLFVLEEICSEYINFVEQIVQSVCKMPKNLCSRCKELIAILIRHFDAQCEKNGSLLHWIANI